MPYILVMTPVVNFENLDELVEDYEIPMDVYELQDLQEADQPQLVVQV